jgi:hypothetical protein
LQENFVDPLKNKPEYKQITQAAIYGSSSDKWNKLNDTSLYNQAT